MLPVTDLVALDIGGANLKAADGLGWTASIPFPLWKRRRELPQALSEILARRPARRIVATMTGEIADCYLTRSAGVADIVAALEEAAAGCVEPPGIYLVDGRIVLPAEAVVAWRLAAASNWHALARLAATLVQPGRGLLIDVGSTTTDIVPLLAGRPAPLAQDDASRMLSGELVYTGVERTAVAAIVRRLPHRAASRPVASELFAESRDAWLVLGELAEDPLATDTADGGPATRAAARTRLARMMLLDPADFTEADAVEAALAITRRQSIEVARAARRVAHRMGWRPDTVVLSGHGELLATQALAIAGWQPNCVRIAELLAPAIARVAPAHALALLARGAIP